MEYFENKKICKECQGECCKTLPGISHPNEFGKTEAEIFENLVKAFSTDNWAVDWYDNFGPEDVEYGIEGYFVRPKIKGIDNIYDPSWGGECIFLEEKGCIFSIEKRPFGCRMLEPATIGKCKVHGSSKYEMAEAWLPYHNIIKKAVLEAKGEA